MSIDPANLANTAHLTYSEEFDTLNWWNGVSGLTVGWGDRENAANLDFPGFAGYGSLSWIPVPNALAESAPYGVVDGNLVISVHETPEHLLDETQNKPYIGGWVDTTLDFSQTYGYFEMRAQMPEGAGLWPAFWLMPTSNEWPPELDVAEFFGDTSMVSGSAHTGTRENHTHEGPDAPVPGGAHASFHTYGVDWNADTVTWYLDGVSIGSVETPSDMHTAMYMIASIGVGSESNIGAPIGTHFPAEMKIDYIRAYAAGARPEGDTSVPNVVPSDDGRPVGGSDEPSEPAPAVAGAGAPEIEEVSEPVPVAGAPERGETVDEGELGAEPSRSEVDLTVDEGEPDCAEPPPRSCSEPAAASDKSTSGDEQAASAEPSRLASRESLDAVAGSEESWAAIKNADIAALVLSFDGAVAEEERPGSARGGPAPTWAMAQEVIVGPGFTCNQHPDLGRARPDFGPTGYGHDLNDIARELLGSACGPESGSRGGRSLSELGWVPEPDART